MSTTTSTGTGTGVRTALPRVNLLPTEISEGVKFRNLQAALALTVILALGVVGFLAYVASGEVSDAQQQVDSAQTQTLQLQGEVASYVAVPKLYAQVDLAKAQLTQAMGQEVRYSFVLRDLSLSIPSTVYLTTMTVAQPVDTPGTVIGAWGGAGVANITFHGQVGKLNDVAAWLDSLTKNKYYSDPFFTVATRLSAGATQPFQFDSSVIVTSKALTGRYPDKAGS
jgi:Tfp pilus assembly protein PilN